MRRRPDILLAALFFLGGAALVAYPYVSDFFYKQVQAAVVWNQEKKIMHLSKDDRSSQKLAAYAYNERLLAGKTVVTDPFDPSQQSVDENEYVHLLNLLNDGVMGSISIPKLGLNNVPIYHGTSDTVLHKGAGHLQSTSLPIGGESAHCVLAGHTGLPSVKIFDGLDRLRVGDYWVIRLLGEEHAYQVCSIDTVLPEETDSLVIQPHKDLCTLVTCTPYGVNSHRLLVHAERCDIPQEWFDLQSRSTSNNDLTRLAENRSLLTYTLIGTAVAVGIGIALIFSKNQRHEVNNKNSLQHLTKPRHLRH